MKIKKIKIKVANQNEPTEIIDIGADAQNIDYNNTTIKAELDKLNTAFDNYYDKDNIDNLLDTKVEKINGKNLSTNDFTNEYKTKVDNIADMTTSEVDILINGVFEEVQ